METKYKLLEFSHKQEANFLMHANHCIDRVFQPQQAAIFKSSNTIHPDHKVRFLALTDEIQTIGVLALYRNLELDKNDIRYLMLGNYCCINQFEASEILLNRAEQIAKELACTILLGPMNGSTWDSYRFCLETALPDYFSEQPCMDWFSKHWEEYGFTVREKYITTIDHQMTHDAPEILEREKTVLTQGITIRQIAGEGYKQEMPRLFEFCTRTFSANVLYSGITEERFYAKHIGLDAHMHAETTLIAENRDKEIVGLIFCFVDHFSKQEKRLIIKTIARDPAPGYRGLPQVMGNFATRYAARNGFNALLHAFMHERNRSVKLSELFSGEIWKRYALFQKVL
jgi:hypothetical protein